MESGVSLWATVITLVTVGGCVVFHFEVISRLRRWSARRAEDGSVARRDRPTLLLVMFGLLAAHVAEIWVFGAAMWLLARLCEASALTGEVITGSFLDYQYFSLANYTTVGWGDLTAEGPLRFLAGMESLIGFLLITWSASFTFLVMDRMWADRWQEEGGREARRRDGA